MSKQTAAQRRYSDYRQTPYWEAVTKAVKQRADYRCQLCNSPHDLQAHHRTYEHRERELEHLGDLICLCRRCHGVFHGVLEAVPAVRAAEAPVVAFAGAAVQSQGKAPVKTRAERAAELIKQMDHAWVEAALTGLPERFELTEELVTRTRIKGTFTTATADALGVTDKKKGWPSRLIGKQITRDAYRAALEGRWIYFKCPEFDRLQAKAKSSKPF